MLVGLRIFLIFTAFASLWLFLVLFYDGGLADGLFDCDDWLSSDLFTDSYFPFGFTFSLDFLLLFDILLFYISTSSFVFFFFSFSFSVSFDFLTYSGCTSTSYFFFYSISDGSSFAVSAALLVCCDIDEGYSDSFAGIDSVDLFKIDLFEFDFE